MVTDWSSEELVEMRELALTAVIGLNGTETRYGLRWHGLCEAIIVLDRVLRGGAKHADGMMWDLSERDAKLLVGLHDAAIAHRREGAPTVPYAMGASARR